MKAVDCGKEDSNSATTGAIAVAEWESISGGERTDRTASGMCAGRNGDPSRVV